MSNTTFKSLLSSAKDWLWRYAKLLDFGASEHEIPSGLTAPTPLEQVGACPPEPQRRGACPPEPQRRGDFWLKREDLSLTGSHKLRSLVYQLSCLRASGHRAAVISSSGNAAISASRYAAAAGIHLFVFVSEQTPLGKLAALTTENTTLILSSRPLRLAKYAAAHFDLPDLRPSVDGAAAIGFRSLGFELFEQQPEVANIFSFVTSGASLRGIHQAYEKLVALGAVDKIPKLFGVYSTGKLAGGLSGGGADRLASIQEICAQSGGALVEITDTEIESARTALTEQGIETSDESVASYAAAEKMKPVGQTVVVLTGKKWANVEVDLSKFQRAETFAEVDQLIQKYV